MTGKAKVQEIYNIGEWYDIHNVYKLNLLKKKKMSFSRLLKKVQEKIDELFETIRENQRYKYFVKNKCCIICAHCDYKNDFRFSEETVCTRTCHKKDIKKLRKGAQNDNRRLCFF